TCRGKPFPSTKGSGLRPSMVVKDRIVEPDAQRRRHPRAAGRVMGTSAAATQPARQAAQQAEAVGQQGNLQGEIPHPPF
ncbi:MAG TPA: hypothetical protein VI855_05720, partial [Dehalococcoidia bacterium]|nr:hypothetical protein [Dehalococcoidia bacterium]